MSRRKHALYIPTLIQYIDSVKKLENFGVKRVETVDALIRNKNVNTHFRVVDELILSK